MTTETQPLKILTRTRSPFNDIFVIERENLREMWFQGNGRFYLQTRIDLDRPGDLALIYTRLLLAPLIWSPNPSRILMIGLGGGVLPRFLNEVYPDIEIDVVDLCTKDPGKDVDLYISSRVRTIVEVWEGDLDMRTALRNASIKATGSRHLIRTMPDWFGVCLYKEVRRGDPELMRQAAE